MKKRFVLYPYLFALYPIAKLFLENWKQLSLSDIAFSLAAVMIATFVFQLTVQLVLNDPKKAGIITSVFLLLFFSYGYLVDWMFQSGIGGYFTGGHKQYILLAYILVFSLIALLVYKARAWISIANKLFGVIGCLLVLFVLINFCIYAPASKPGKPHVDNNTMVSEEQSAEEAAGSPDIYYIILDEFAGIKQIEEVYHYRHPRLADYLARKGFYIAKNSAVRFDSTVNSLAISLNMRFLGKDDDSFAMIRDNKVARLLKSRGYEYIHFGSWLSPTSYNRLADININDFAFNNEFMNMLVRTSILRPFIDSSVFSRARVLRRFEKIAAVPDIKTDRPKFVFAHIICPHEPFVFGPNGEEIDREDKSNWDDKSLYLGQYIFISKKVESLVDSILSKSKKPPVIIIQSDHGVRRVPSIDSEYAYQIFNAYYLPYGGNRVLWNSISPANTFRVIFNYYFRTKYKILDG